MGILRTVATWVLASLIVGFDAPVAVNAALTEAAWTEVDSDEVTQHEIMLDGQKISYSAHVGHLTLKRDDGRPFVTLFYVSYSKSGDAAARRPITFLNNGGPGSPTLWLHVGGFGPVRVTKSDVASGRPQFVANPYSLLDKTDLVFIDAPETGFSRLVGDGKADDIAGVDQDVDVFARFIDAYIRQENRWQSPKYVYGESYGTPRTAALAAALYARGISLSGLILQSTVLNYNRRGSGMDINFAVTLPSFAAAAWHFDKVRHVGSEQAFIDQARTYATGAYLHSLFLGDAISDSDAATVADQLSHFTGISPSFIRASNLRVTVPRFRKELLRERGLVIGRYDARETGKDDDTAGEQSSWDPSDEAITNAYSAAFQNYLASNLHYRSAISYRTYQSRAESHMVAAPQAFYERVRNAGETPLADTTVDLGAVMRSDPHLWVFSANGIYDLGTPFTGAEHDLSHLVVRC